MKEALNNKDISKEEFDLADKVPNELIQQINGKVEKIIIKQN